MALASGVVPVRVVRRKEAVEDFETPEHRDQNPGSPSPTQFQNKTLEILLVLAIIHDENTTGQPRAIRKHIWKISNKKLKHCGDSRSMSDPLPSNFDFRFLWRSWGAFPTIRGVRLSLHS
jgi:hypothetical protein